MLDKAECLKTQIFERIIFFIRQLKAKQTQSLRASLENFQAQQHSSPLSSESVLKEVALWLGQQLF